MNDFLTFDLTQYINDAVRTEAPWGNFFRNVLPPDGPHEAPARVSHAIEGFVTESGELVEWMLNRPKKHWWQFGQRDKTNLTEELGDWCWYMAIYMSARGDTEMTMVPAHGSVRDHVHSLCIYSSRMADL